MSGNLNNTIIDDLISIQKILNTEPLEQRQAIAMDKNDYLINNKNVYKKQIPKGCKIYQFGSFECIAINYKTAQRKFNKYMLNKIKL